MENKTKDPHKGPLTMEKYTVDQLKQWAAEWRTQHWNVFDNDRPAPMLAAFAQHVLRAAGLSDREHGKAEVGHELFAGIWHAWFRIGNQTFHISPIRGEEGEKGARWQAEMLRSAFGIPRIGDVPERPANVHLPDPLKP